MSAIDETLAESPLHAYRRFLEQGMLAYQWDTVSNRPFFYPRVIAPGSGDVRPEWRTSSGIGTVYAVTVIQPKDVAPYNIVLIDMAEGFRLMSTVEGLPAHDVRIGMRVRACVQRDTDNAPYPVFYVERS